MKPDLLGIGAILGVGVSLVALRMERIVGDPWNRSRAVFRVEPPGTCLICLGVGGCGWQRFIPCWHCTALKESRT